MGCDNQKQQELMVPGRTRMKECVCVFFAFQELTGKLPKEYPLDPGEEPPTVRRKIGTAFKLDEQKILPKGEVH